MKIVVQRVKEASVIVDEELKGKIQKGFLLYVCFETDDTPETIKEAIYKITNLRIFEDEKGKMNQNIEQAKGDILSVSQFTLSWDGKKGHRPSFDKSKAPQEARLFYHSFNKQLRDLGYKVSEGVFGAEMAVSSINDGPVTFHLSF